MHLLKPLQKCLLLSLLLTVNLSADTNLELMFSVTNPDYKPFQSEEGVAFNGAYSFDNGLFISGYYNATDFTASGPEVGGETVKSWAEAGVGYAFDSQWGHYYSLITLESIDTENKTYDGYGAHFGYRNDFAEDWSGTLQFGYIDTGFDDWQLLVKLYYDISDRVDLTLGIRDYHLWDMTNYEAGIKFKF